MRLCEFLYRRTGMVFTEAKRYYIERRLFERMNSLGMTSFAPYFAAMWADPAEVETLINNFTINETYFYREDHQFRCLTSSLLGEIVGRKPRGQPVRLWSVPCSTGEEPFSIAIWLLENWPQVDLYDVEIVGSDIDTKALEAAQAGLYGQRALMRLPPSIVRTYFRKTSPDRWQLIDDLRGSVKFTCVNLVDQAAMRGQGPFDIVFCRNVLIYFDETSRRTAAENIYESLVPGGYVCLGHTESMSRISPLFEVCRYADAIVYRKPLESTHA